MIPTLAILFVSSLWIGLSGALMPGPLFATNLRESTARGAIAGPLVTTGHAIAEIAVVLGVAVFGLGALLQAPLVRLPVFIAGGLIMLWMGWGMLREARVAALPGEAQPSAGSRRGAILGGIIASVTSPYWILWWATGGLAQISAAFAAAANLGIAVFFLGHITSDALWLTLWSVGIGKGRQVLPLGLYRGLIGVCGVALLGFGLWFAGSGALDISALLGR